ncbi:MAG: hypothetical protein RXP99_00250 [Vulcanisaeta sp.]
MDGLQPLPGPRKTLNSYGKLLIRISMKSAGCIMKKLVATET